MPDPISWEFAGPYLALALAGGYLLGSVPFGLVLTRMAGLGDLREIGSGGMGSVYEARHLYIDKRVALKLLRPEIASNQEALSRFQREAMSASTIGHETGVVGLQVGFVPRQRELCLETERVFVLDLIEVYITGPIDALINVVHSLRRGPDAAELELHAIAELALGGQRRLL